MPMLPLEILLVVVGVALCFAAAGVNPLPRRMMRERPPVSHSAHETEPPLVYDDELDGYPKRDGWVA